MAQLLIAINSSAIIYFTLSAIRYSQLGSNQSSGNGFQWRTFPFPWLPELPRATATAILGYLLPTGHLLQTKSLYAIQEGGLFTN
jgi:hypothetical protein